MSFVFTRDEIGRNWWEMFRSLPIIDQCGIADHYEEQIKHFSREELIPKAREHIYYRCLEMRWRTRALQMGVQIPF